MAPSLLVFRLSPPLFLFSALGQMVPLNLFLEMEIGITGGEEDGVNNEDVDPEKLYTTPQQVQQAPILPAAAVASAPPRLAAAGGWRWREILFCQQRRWLACAPWGCPRGAATQPPPPSCFARPDSFFLYPAC